MREQARGGGGRSLIVHSESGGVAVNPLSSRFGSHYEFRTAGKARTGTREREASGIGSRVHLSAATATSRGAVRETREETAWDVSESIFALGFR
jgi:hypothetical protein